MIKTLAHLCVFSKDLNRSLDFYCSALGLKRHFDFIKNGALFGFYLQVAPGQFIEIFKADPAMEIRSQRIHHFCLEVDDIDALRDKLIKHGVEVTPKNWAATSPGSVGAKTRTARTWNSSNICRRVRNSRKQIAS